MTARSSRYRKNNPRDSLSLQHIAKHGLQGLAEQHQQQLDERSRVAETKPGDRVYVICIGYSRILCQHDQWPAGASRMYVSIHLYTIWEHKTNKKKKQSRSFWMVLTQMEEVLSSQLSRWDPFARSSPDLTSPTIWGGGSAFLSVPR